MKVAASAVDGRKGVDAIAVSDATGDEVEEMKSELKTPESQSVFTKSGSKTSSIFKKSVAKTMLMTRINRPTGTRNVMLKIAGTMVVGDSASIDLAAADDEDEDDATREQAAARKKALLARKLDLKKKLRAHATSVGSESQRDIVKKQKSSVKDMYKLESDIGDSGRKKPRFMVTPQQRIPWDIFLCSLLGYISLTVPYRVGFGVEASGPLLYFEAAIDFCFLADVVVNFRTVIVEKDREIWNRRTIARNYFKSWFFIDLISSLPFDLLITASNGSGHGMLGPLTRAMKMFKFSKIAKILRVAKIAKLLRINKLLKSSPALEDFIEETVSSSNMANKLKLVQLVLLTFTVSHVMACILAAVSRNVPTSWADHYTDTNRQRDSETGDWYYDDDEIRVTGHEQHKWRTWSTYIATIYWAMTTITTVGYGDICPNHDGERLYAMAAMCVGGAFYGYIIGNISSIVTSHDANSGAYFEKMDQIHAYMLIRRFPKQLRRKVHRHFKKFFSERTALDECAILNDMAPQLRQEVAVFLLKDTVKRHILFRYLPKDAIAGLVVILKPCTGEPGRSLIVEGTPGKTMFVVESGSVELRSRHFGVETGSGKRIPRSANVFPGDSFGEETVIGLSKDYRCTANALERCDLFMINKEDLAPLLESAGSEVAQKLCELAEEETKALFLKLARGSPGDELEPDGTVTLAAGMTEISHGKMGTLNGGGEKTLPPGFADNVASNLSDILGTGESTSYCAHRVERHVRELDRKVEAVAADVASLGAQMARVLTLLEPRAGGSHAPPPAAGAGEPAASPTDAAIANGVGRVRLSFSGFWLETSHGTAATCPYMRLVRVPRGGLKYGEDEFSVDDRDVVWTSQAHAKTNNPDWDPVTFDKAALGETLLLQSFDWTSHPPHAFIGARKVTSQELISAGVAQSEEVGRFTLELVNPKRREDAIATGGQYTNSGSISIDSLDWETASALSPPRKTGLWGLAT